MGISIRVLDVTQAGCRASWWLGVRTARLVAVLALLAAAGCSSSSSGDGGSGSCDVKPGAWMNDCAYGCGDVMTCASFCGSCELRCQVTCIDSTDCARVGAGTCKQPSDSAGDAVCSNAPSQCADSSSSGGGGSGGSGGATGSGGSGGSGGASSCIPLTFDCTSSSKCCPDERETVCNSEAGYCMLCGQAYQACGVSSDCCSGLTCSGGVCG